MSKEWKIEVICSDINNNPHCFHGPTLKFRRTGLKESEYFACSACRDRRDCTFFMKANETNNKQCKRAKEQRQEALVKILSLGKLRKKIKCEGHENRCFCHSHNVLFCKDNIQEHIKCNKTVGISDYLLKHPTQICLPKQNNKVEAQYFFSKETTEFLISTIKSLSVDKVLCIGTPRLHEILVNDLNMSSILLDIDPKYHYFYPKKYFIWFNMFNNFCFDDKRRLDLETYLKEGKILILLDPPFGGRVEPIANTLNNFKEICISLQNKCALQIMWFFPYFMEGHIKDSLPEFRMLDYQVNYENHGSFTDKGSRRRKTGSPVRIFTTIPLGQFTLSNVRGYKYCVECKFYVHETNSHCFKCGSCTSKNGTRYVHCALCRICVKPSYAHCAVCQRCCLKTHKCGEFTPDGSCYHCHIEGHKKSHCPALIKKQKFY